MVRANFQLLWSGRFCGVPFSLSENGHERKALYATHTQGTRSGFPKEMWAAQRPGRAS
jgi:hypothetical protein